ncbi:hypothetical protein [Sphingomonas sp. CROZ-RG-20F-R02-07]|uniref:DUF6950 family protein n=1 Tax=Sphingomonas sp. CROZ-RG-20F-R02-07 TaxID=2914832 RepID=UPI001F598BA3|nr:hypothetical protein [Sphingomonas sp. CROZ-RG-20F-R02-07]
MTEANHEMIRRVAAAQATLEEFRDKPFKMGERDCVRMVAAHLRRLGYKVRLPAKGSYASVKTALKALRVRGFGTLADALDAMGLERVAPAATLPGDIVQGESADALGALGIVLSNGRLVGYHEHAPGAAVLQRLSLSAAWRVKLVA